ncbi:ABC transporter substrate-binding protein [Streptomyces sp. NPDC057638]|uniref:ABC transporter substrate-binding protein n=1 Tax=Streptomyces sp. NPDC057638 TaxID=3346190 RepID=UPI0036CFBD2E
MTGSPHALPRHTPARTASRRPRRPPFLVGALALAVLATGCGLLPGSGSRAPITVMTFAPEHTPGTNMPGMPAMALAYARWANTEGGLDGHELRVLTCDELNTSAGAADCARRAVDEDAVAVVGSYSQHGASFMAPLEAAGIPFLGGYGLTDSELTSYLSYPVNGGQPALLAGHGTQLADVCRRVSLVRPDSIAGDRLPGLLDSGLAPGGLTSTDHLAPEDATDYTAVAARARRTATALDTGTGTDTRTGGPDRSSLPGCVTAALGDATETFFDSFRRLPEDDRPVSVSSVLGSVDQSLINRTGGARGLFEGAHLTGWYPEAGDDRWNPMRRVIDEHAFGDDRIDPTNAGVQTTWIAYTALREVVESLDQDEVTARDITRALDGGVRVDTGGLTPSLRWTYDDLLDLGGFPRVVNRSVTLQVVRGGRLVAQRETFLDVTLTLTTTPRT